MALVVHPHFHPRRTGVTAHIETVVPALDQLVKTRAISKGVSLNSETPTLSLPELKQALQNGQPTIWHAHRNGEMLHGIVLRARYPHLKLVYTRHTSSAPSWTTRHLLAKADHVVVLNEESLNYVSTPASVVYHGINQSRFPSARSLDCIRPLIKHEGAPVLAVVGRVRPEKGHEILTQAVLPLIQDHPTLNIVFIGHCAKKDKNWLAGLQKKTLNKIQYLGQRNDMPGIYQGIDILVLPSFREGLSCTVLEAMSSGCCVITTDLSDFHKVIHHGKSGYLFPIGDHETLSNQLGELLRAPLKAKMMGEAASRVIADRFTAQHEAQGLHSIYQSLLETM